MRCLPPRSSAAKFQWLCAKRRVLVGRPPPGARGGEVFITAARYGNTSLYVRPAAVAALERWGQTWKKQARAQVIDVLGRPAAPSL